MSNENDIIAQRLATLWQEMNNRHENENIDKISARIKAALVELNKAHGIA